MPPVHHRNPGVIPAAVECPHVRAELICDGYHIHPASIRLAFAMFGGERMIIVSDSGRCAGQPEGYQFDLGGQMAEIRGGVAKLVGSETIACSATNLWQCLVNTISFGVKEEDVIRACTYNPACALGVQAEVGSIAEGLVADFLVCTDGYESKRVFLAGKEI
jgi:N-acetylglucosamine-6-phosphate deacetylase